MGIKIKAICIAVTSLLLIAAGYALGHRDAVQSPERVVNHDVVRYVDRVVTKHSVKTVIAVNGSKTTTVVDSNSDTTTQSHSHDTATIRAMRPQYSVGLMMLPKLQLPISSDYQLTLGKRLGDSPVSITTVVQTDNNFKQPRIGVGISIEL